MQLSPQSSVGVKNSNPFYEKAKSKISLSTPLKHMGGGWFHLFFTSSLRGGVNFTPRPLFPRERTPGTHWTGGWVWAFCRRGISCFISLGFFKHVFIDSALCRVIYLCVNIVTMKCYRGKTHAINYSILVIKSYYICKIVRYLYVTLCRAYTEARRYTHCWTQSCWHPK